MGHSHRAEIKGRDSVNRVAPSFKGFCVPAIPMGLVHPARNRHVLAIIRGVPLTTASAPYSAFAGERMNVTRCIIGTVAILAGLLTAVLARAQEPQPEISGVI